MSQDSHNNTEDNTDSSTTGTNLVKETSSGLNRLARIWAGAGDIPPNQRLLGYLVGSSLFVLSIIFIVFNLSSRESNLNYIIVAGILSVIGIFVISVLRISQQGSINKSSVHKLTFLVTLDTQPGIGIDDAKIHVTGYKNKVLDVKNGQAILKYDNEAIRQNQRIGIFATKDDIGESVYREITLTGRTEPERITIITSAKNTAKVDVVSQPKLSPQQATTDSEFLDIPSKKRLIELLVKAGLVDPTPAVRDSLLSSIEFPEDLSFNNPSVKREDFARLLLDAIEKRGKKNSLILLCETLLEVYKDGDFEYQVKEILNRLTK